MNQVQTTRDPFERPVIIDYYDDEFPRDVQVTKVDFTLPKYNKSRPIIFLHIPKSGGTSFSNAMRPIIKRLRGYYVGAKHFDWSYVRSIPKADVIVMLRHPVDRAVSQYYYE